GAGSDEHRHAAAELDDIGVGHPIRRGHDHLVARLHRRDQRVEQRMLAADVHADLIGRVGEAVVARELGDDRRLQLGNAIDIGVFGLAVADRLDRGVLDE
nr:hypothetical protein [Tanacetum cinerariifolium]